MICNRTSVARILCTALYFLFSGIEYAVILPTLNGFLNSMDAPDGFIGIAMASFSFTGLVTAPIYGRISDKTRSAKLSVIVSNLFEIAGNFLYFAGSNYYVIWISRLVAGIGSGSSSSILGMVSKTTTEEERTRVFSILLSLRQFGLLIGPGLNVFLDGLDFKLGTFPVNQYTSPGLLMAIIWVFHTLLMVAFYHDADVLNENGVSGIANGQAINAKHENTYTNGDLGEENAQNDLSDIRNGHVTSAELSSGPNTHVRTFVEEFLREEVILCLALTFMTMFVQTGIEAGVTPMTLLFFDWDGLYNSYMYCGAGFVVVFGYIILGLLSKRVSDRFLLLLGCTGFLITYLLDTVYTAVFAEWNGLDTPSWVFPLFCVGTFLLTLSLPFVWISLVSLYSKITSTETQGFNQGIRLVAMGLGQILGPLWAAPMVTSKRLPIMLGLALFLMCLLTAMVLLSYDRLVPSSSPPNPSIGSNSDCSNDSENTPLLHGSREALA